MSNPVTENERDIYRVKLTDGMSSKTIYIYAYSVKGAIEKAEGSHPNLKWLRCRKVSYQNIITS